MCGEPKGDSRKAQTHNDLAREALNRKPADLSGAEIEVKKALAFDPRNEESYLIWGAIDFLRAQMTMQLVERADCLSGSDGEALRAEADEAARRAEDHWKKATELAPDYGEAWQNRGAAALYFQDWDKAVEYETKALANLARLTSETAARSNLGWAQFKRGDRVHAVTALLQAAQGEQYACFPSYRLAEIYFSRGELEEALERLRPVLDNPKLCVPIQEAQRLGGQVYVQLHDAESASRAFHQCIDMAPKSCQARECDQLLRALTP